MCFLYFCTEVDDIFAMISITKQHVELAVNKEESA